VLKFHDDPTLNEFEIIIFLRQVWWYAEKRVFWEEEKEKEIERKRRREKHRLKNDLRCLYL